MAGFWPSSFLRVHGLRWIWGPSTRKKRTRPIFNHLDQTSLVNKGFLITKKSSIFLRDTAGNPELARKRHLDRLGSQSQRRISFILPAHRVSHIINNSLTNLDYLHLSSSSKHISIMITKQKKSFHCSTNHWYCPLCPYLQSNEFGLLYSVFLILKSNK